MRFISNTLVFLLSVSTALSLNNNNPETWHSPNKKYAVKESFYGEGKRVIAVFVNLSTGRSVVIDGSGARNSTARRREEFPRLSFLPAWKLPGSCHLLRRTRFCTSGRRQSVRSDGLTLIGSSLSPRQPAPASTGRGTDPQTASRWMSSGTSSSRFPEAQ